MTVKAEILADSIHPLTGRRLTTMRLMYPRGIHAELMTHRALARNASSSRAIPSKRQRRMIRQDPGRPAEWGRNQGGMQAGAPIARWRQLLARSGTWVAMQACLLLSAFLDLLGVHKQVVNRYTEAWAHITVIATGTDEAWANFYALRNHPMAEPTMQLLAKAMLEAHAASTPRMVQLGEWHAPLLDPMEREELLKEPSLVLGTIPYMSSFHIPIAIKRSAARCARTSYLKPDMLKATAKEDLDLYQRLVGSAPVHATPTEHQAIALDPFLSANNRSRGGCFGASSGWAQHRKFIPGENVTNLREQLARSDFETAKRLGRYV